VWRTVRAAKNLFHCWAVDFYALLIANKNARLQGERSVIAFYSFALLHTHRAVEIQYYPTRTHNRLGTDVLLYFIYITVALEEQEIAFVRRRVIWSRMKIKRAKRFASIIPWPKSE